VETDQPRFDFSYSGIKTAVLRYVEVHEMQASIETRRKALAKIPKPKLEDYLANCDTAHAGSGRIISAYHRRRPGGQNPGRGPRLRRGFAVRHRWSCGE
jgi:hypothetical protein